MGPLPQPCPLNISLKNTSFSHLLLVSSKTPFLNSEKISFRFYIHLMLKNYLSADMITIILDKSGNFFLSWNSMNNFQMQWSHLLESFNPYVVSIIHNFLIATKAPYWLVLRDYEGKSHHITHEERSSKFSQQGLVLLSFSLFPPPIQALLGLTLHLSR